VDSLRTARKDRATFIRIVANRNYIIELFPGEFIYRLRTMAGDVYANLTHSLDRQRSNVAGFDTGARDLEPVASVVSQEAFGHLASG
jgi:hypothetical protein